MAKIEELQGPIENPFKKFSTMTYSVSIYLQSPKHFALMMSSDTGYKSVKGLPLIMQSGGIQEDNDFGAVRSPHFAQDFYLDDIQFTSFVSGQSTGGAHNMYDLNFTVTEPNGLTFLDKLAAAVQDYQVNVLKTSPEHVNFIAQNFLMVVRFYGYDAYGNLVGRNELDVTQPSDRKASQEKFIPFMFKNITFRLETNKVIYSCSAVPIPNQIALDKIHGTIPMNVNFQGNTLNELFNGKKGLCELLNSHQRKLVRDGKQEVADTYKVEFQTNSDIGSATVIQPGTPLFARTGYPDIKQAANKLLQGSTGAGKAETNKRSYAANAGMKIYHFLDLATRTSTYITNQFRQMHDQNKTNTSKKTGVKNDESMKWFKISTKVVPGDYDKIRGGFSFEITYVITEFPLSAYNQSPYFSDKECFNLNKEYDFWFTGKNTEVLNFSQDYNFLYYTSFGSKKIGSPANNLNINGRQMAYQVNSREPGQESGGNEEAANAATILYSPADQAMASIDIVGDPDWIGQSELFFPATANGDRLTRISPDGSINMNSSEIHFAINFNTIVDYDLEDGLTHVTDRNVGRDPATSNGGVSQYQLIYRANTIVTQLRSGKFTQRLNGTIKFIPDSCIRK